MELYMTIREAAELFDVDQSTVWRWYKNGLLQPAMMIDGRRPLFAKSEIERRIEDRLAWSRGAEAQPATAA